MGRRNSAANTQSTKLRRGDEVIVLAGDDRGRRGKIVSIDRVRGRAIVEGVNRAKVHQRPTQNNPQGGISEKELPVDLSNIRYWDSTEDQASKIRRVTGEDGRRVRVSAASGETLED